MTQPNCPLHGLSIELHTLILLQLDSTKSLSALIHASPYLFAVFLSAKEKILSACALRGVEPEVLPTAIVAAEAYFLPRGPDKINVIGLMHRLDELETGDSMDWTISISTSVQLSRLCRTVDFMILDFVDYIKKKTEGYEFYSRQETDASFLSNPLSITERGRLQRAFFTLELYPHVFHSEPHQNSTFTAMVQSRIFFGRLPSWQITELACVHEYLIDRLGGIFDEVENRFVACVLEENARAATEKDARFENFCFEPHVDSASDCELRAYSGSECMSESISESQTMEDTDSDDDSDYGFSLPLGHGPDRFDGEDLFFANHTKYPNHRVNMEYMIPLGLKFFHNLFLADGEKRFQLVVASAKYGGDFLRESLEERSGKHLVVENISADQKDEIPVGHSLEFYGDRLRAPNLAWLWSFGFTQYSTSYGIDDSLQGCFLRSWGYTFWDAIRIQSFHLLDDR